MLTSRTHQIYSSDRYEDAFISGFLGKYGNRESQSSKSYGLIGKVTRHGISVGVGFYVGFMEGNNTPLDPATKYMLLASPTAAMSIITPTLLHFSQKSVRMVLENPTAFGELQTRLATSSEDSNRLSELEQIADNKHYVRNESLRSIAEITVETGVGFLLGYYTAKLMPLTK